MDFPNSRLIWTAARDYVHVLDSAHALLPHCSIFFPAAKVFQRI
jgi:hypothetical protein